MNRLKSSFITVGIVLVLLVLVVAGFFLIPLSSDKALQVFFLSCTNDAALGKLAVFAVTNVSNEKISFGLYRSQVKTSGEWSKLAYRSYETGLPPITIDLSPHKAATFVNIVVTNGNVWRVPVDWCYTAPHPIESFRGNLVENIYWNRNSCWKENRYVLPAAHGLEVTLPTPLNSPIKTANHAKYANKLFWRDLFSKLAMCLSKLVTKFL